MENNSWSWNGWTYYITKTGKMKKVKFDEKPIKCSAEEWDENAKKYVYAMGLR